MFTDRLRLALTLVVGGDTFAFASGAFERVELVATTYGFEAEVSFYVSSEDEEDTVFAPFTSDALAQATISIATCVLDGTGEEPDPVAFTGPVVERWLSEEVSDEVVGEPVVGRSYCVRFCDAAAALWRQHRPLDLLTGASLQEAIEAHKAEGISLSYDWGKLDEKHDVLCLSAGASGPASFYDLLFWYVEREGGVVERDAASGAYRIGGEKTRLTASPSLLEPEYVERLALEPAEPPRASWAVRNASAVAAATASIDSPHAATGVAREALVRTPIAAEADRRATTEKARRRPPGHELSVVFGRCPPELRAPGDPIALGGDFSEKLLAAGRTYRLLELRLSAAAAEAEDEPALDDETAPFDIELSMRAEVASSPRRHLPRVTAPRYPVVVEGKVVSSGGGDDDRTWAAFEDEDTSLVFLQVQIPLWNKTVIAPFEPNRSPGHLFFPPYKGQRVLVALDLHGARVTGFVDWADNARTTAEAQGNKLVLGYQAINGTTIEHAYVDGKPALTIARTFGNDLQTIEVREGVIRFEVREDPAAQELEPSYDVTVVVDASKARVGGEVDAALGEVSGAFEGSFGGASGKLDEAIEGVGAAIGAAEAKLVAAIEQLDGELAGLSSSLVATTEAMTAAVADAKAALEQALS